MSIRRRGVSYFGCRVLRHIAADLAALAEAGFDYVVHTVSENDLRFYSTTMREIYAATRDAGLEAHVDPWGVGGLFSGEAFSATVAETPDACQVDNRGRHRAALCPRSDEARDLMRAWLDGVADTDASRLFIDEPHLALDGDAMHWSCYCDRCRRAFESANGHSMPVEFSDAVAAFRRETVRDFTAWFARLAHSAGLPATLCVLPPEIAGPTVLPLEDAFTVPGVDTVAGAPYWIQAELDADRFVGDVSTKLAALGQRHNKAAQIWIQGFGIPRGRESEVHDAVRAARAAGVDDLAVWGFEACAHMSSLRPDEPADAWRAILDAFAE